MGFYEITLVKFLAIQQLLRIKTHPDQFLNDLFALSVDEHGSWVFFFGGIHILGALLFIFISIIGKQPYLISVKRSPLD